MSSNAFPLYPGAAPSGVELDLLSREGKDPTVNLS